MGLGLGRGLVNLFKKWGTDIGNAADNVWLRADAQKAIRDAVEKKYQPKIDLVQRAENKRAENIKDLQDKLATSKKEFQDAQKAWQDKYNTALANAQSKKQADIADYNQQLQRYNEALASAKADRQSILDQLYASEAYTPSKTIFRDVTSGENFIIDPFTNNFVKLTKSNAPKGMKNYEHRLFDTRKDKVINAFDEKDITNYRGNPVFDNYFNNKQNAALRNAERQVKQAEGDLTNWQTNNTQPKAWNKNDLTRFEQDFKHTNGESPTEFSFNGQTYSNAAKLDKAYKKALNRAQTRLSHAQTVASDYTKRREAEIARSIQDAKDMNKAKVALGGTLGAGTLYAAARAMYGGHDTDNPDNIDNTNNTDNTNNGEPDSNFNVKNLPEVQAQLNDEQQSDTGFDPDKADALARASYDVGVEDGNSIASSDDLGNRIAASTGGHTIDDKLFELIKAMQDPYKADAVANYIYSRHGDNPELQRLGWRAWLNKYYGDSLRSMMNIDPSGYKGMHISGGL